MSDRRTGKPVMHYYWSAAAAAAQLTAAAVSVPYGGLGRRTPNDKVISLRCQKCITPARRREVRRRGAVMDIPPRPVLAGPDDNRCSAVTGRTGPELPRPSPWVAAAGSDRRGKRRRCRRAARRYGDDKRHDRDWAAVVAAKPPSAYT